MHINAIARREGEHNYTVPLGQWRKESQFHSQERSTKWFLWVISAVSDLLPLLKRQEAA